MEQAYEEIDIRELANIILNKWWIIALTTGTAAIIACVMSFMIIQPVYSAYTTLFVGNSNEGLLGNVSDVSSELLNVNSKLMGDYMELAKSKLVASEVIRELDLNYTPAEFIKTIDVVSIRDTRIFRISFEGTKPQEIAQIVDKFADVLKKYAKEIVLMENIRVIDKAEVPMAPIKPSKMMNLVIGSMLGGMLGVAIIFIQHFLDNTLKAPSDVEKLLGLPVLGAIPTFKGEEKR